MLSLREEDAPELRQTLAAANALYRALRNMGCTCSHNVPYAGCKVEQVVVTPCSRCLAIAAWEAVHE
jgi:hypothetical protein